MLCSCPEPALCAALTSPCSSLSSQFTEICSVTAEHLGIWKSHFNVLSLVRLQGSIWITLPSFLAWGLSQGNKQEIVGITFFHLSQPLFCVVYYPMSESFFFFHVSCLKQETKPSPCYFTMVRKEICDQI